MYPNILVALFFLHNVLATLLLGIKFRGRPDAVFKHFGSALILNSVAFAIWSLAIITRPQNLEVYVTLGVLFFIASLIALLAAGIHHIPQAKRQSILAGGTVIAGVLFILRTFVYPSTPGFTPEGLFFFNAHPIVQIIYVFGFAFAALPAIEALAGRFNNLFYSNLVRYSLIAQVVGGSVLIISTNSLVSYYSGWVMGAAYILLWPALLFGQKAWSGVK